MKRKHFLTVNIGILCTCLSYAQNDIDVMRYSQLTFGGTARFNSMAGSMGALGGDISTLSFNPAGIGIFRKSEFSISPAAFYQGTSSTYKEVNTIDGRLNFNIGNVGLIATYKMKDTTRGWHYLNFGFGYNRTNNFYNSIRTIGNNKTSSLLDTYVEDANGQDPADFDAFSTDLAYQAYLINPLPPDSINYYHVISNYGQQQDKLKESAGSMGETALSLGGNFRDKIFIGATLGIVNARYVEQVTYKEIDEKDTIKYFKSFTLNQNLNSKGTGINFKMGVIIKATDWLRIGGAIHTPTRISMNDIYSNSISADLDGAKYTAESGNGTFNYSVTTPFRALGSVGFIIKKYGLFNVEYEYVNYKNARLSSSPNVFSDVNTFIRQHYVSAGNVRIGGEVRLDPISLRIGYALYGSPFASGLNKAAQRSSMTAGIGFRKNSFSVDFGYVLSAHTDYSYLYDPYFNDAVIKNNYTSSSFLFTFGFRF